MKQICHGKRLAFSLSQKKIGTFRLLNNEGVTLCSPTDKKEPQRLPDFTLSGKIIEKRDRQDDVRQVTYAFQLSLTNNDGLAVWEDEKEISKQSKRGVIGW